jgi:hypothetical protein
MEFADFGGIVNMFSDAWAGIIVAYVHYSILGTRIIRFSFHSHVYRSGLGLLGRIGPWLSGSWQDLPLAQTQKLRLPVSQKVSSSWCHLEELVFWGIAAGLTFFSCFRV